MTACVCNHVLKVIMPTSLQVVVPHVLQHVSTVLALPTVLVANRVILYQIPINVPLMLFVILPTACIAIRSQLVVLRCVNSVYLDIVYRMVNVLRVVLMDHILSTELVRLAATTVSTVRQQDALIVQPTPISFLASVTPHVPTTPSAIQKQ